MWKFINEIISSFRPCFSRKASFRWFAVMVTSFLLRTDKAGVTSAIRDLYLDSSCYEKLIHFFHSDAWNLSVLRRHWIGCIRKHAPAYKLNNRICIVIDGKKQSKEAHHMAGCKKLVQESGTQSKPEHICGHLFGATSILIGDDAHKRCVPLKINIQDGNRPMAKWEGSGISGKSHVAQMGEDACAAAIMLNHDGYILADRYFLSRSLVEILEAKSREAGIKIDLITKAKRNAVAYKEPEKKTGRGRPRKKGDTVRLRILFDERRSDFTTEEVTMYGKKKTVSYLVVDLLWGNGFYRKLRFVLVEMEDGTQSILATTDLELDGRSVIEAYCYRFKIESMFREMSQVLGAFSYHFWSKAVPFFSHFRKSTDKDPLESVTDHKQRKKIIDNHKAIEMYLFISSVAMGLLQITAFKFKLEPEDMRYQRTESKSTPSELNMSYTIRKLFFRSLGSGEENTINAFIRECQSSR